MVSRRQFLRGDLSGRNAPLRPPWALEEERFLEVCTRCGDCAKACPQKILVIERGYPRVNFFEGECDFCAECVKACKPRALRREGEDSPPWRLAPLIASSCIAQQNIICRSCGDACEAGAIRFSHRPGCVPRPEVEGDKCTGCGACVAPCPAKAIAVQRK